MNSVQISLSSGFLISKEQRDEYKSNMIIKFYKCCLHDI